MEKTQHELVLDRIQLCAEVIRSVHQNLEIPTDADQKADLYMAAEYLGMQAVILHKQVSDLVFPDEVPVED
jgi:hypothetical protein